MQKRRTAVFVSFLLLAAVAAIALWLYGSGTSPRVLRLRQWFNDPAAYADWAITAGERCGDAPMLLPTTGYIGFGYGDSFRPGHQHSGLDIFSPDGKNNVTPIVAAYDGYLTRESNWRSTVILRHPDFSAVPPELPQSGEQIWTYYTHMASRDGTESYVAAEFPAGTRELFVEAGTLLGYQGNWAGSAASRTGLHLHFSIVKSKPDGGYLDERELVNTFEPLPFLGLKADARGIIRCESDS